MSSIFLLTKKVRGPGGHGEPGMEYIALAEDGNGWVLGDPYPAFATRQLAEAFRKERGMVSSHVITEVSLVS